MRRVRPNNTLANAATLRFALRCLPASGALLLFAGSGASALTLGDLRVTSALGQPLEATVALMLAPGEVLTSDCITPNASGVDGLGPVPEASIETAAATRAGSYALRINSARSLYEPMYALNLAVNCPGAPAMVRQYVLMLDLPGMAEARVPVAAVTDQPAERIERTEREVRSPTERPSTPLASGTRYRVAAGDTLSSIAARITNRQASIWATADAIQAANPEAFIRGDANLLKLGAELTLPDGAAVAAPTQAVAEPAPMAPPGTEVPPPEAPVTTDLVTTGLVAADAEVVVPSLPALPAVELKPETPVASRPGAVQADPASSVESEPSPWWSVLAGIVFGLFVSMLFWFVGRWPARQRERTGTPASAVRREAESTAAMPIPVPLVTRPTEPGFSVSYETVDDDPLAAEFIPPPEHIDTFEPLDATAAMPSPGLATRAASAQSSEEITAELEELFDDTDTALKRRVEAEKTVAARALRAPESAEDTEVDFAIGDPTGTEAALDAPTVEQPAPTVEQPRPNLRRAAAALNPSDTGTIDLHALAASGSQDQRQAQTLLEALTLLERDYEEELTASQILDQSAVRKALAAEDPTQANLERPVERRRKAR
jgi:Tfp pilus assembly protein FimV